jgi:two-component system response regulator
VGGGKPGKEHLVEEKLEVDILVVEDDDEQRATIVEALLAELPAVQVAAVASGAEALDFLFRFGKWAQRVGVPPKVVLLDLMMPNLDGFNVLDQLRAKQTECMTHLTPVVIFSDSHSPSDVSRSYRCGANSFVAKPVGYPEFQSAVASIGRYWVAKNQNPS